MPVPHATESFFLTPTMNKPSPISNDQLQKRRSSSRSIKRKKFDDELVESSLVKTSRARPPCGIIPVPSPGTSASTIAASSSVSSIPVVPVASVSQPLPEVFPLVVPEKRKPRLPAKRVKKSKNNQTQLLKDISRWKPTDDLALILSVQQTNDLEAVFRGVAFSCKFSLQEIHERWYALLYNAQISKPASSAMKHLSQETISQIQAKVLFSMEEEKLIGSVHSAKGNLEVFQQLLSKHSQIFLPSRTAKALFTHWVLMKQYNLLSDQSVQRPQPGSDCVLTFSDAEEQMDDAKLLDPKNENLDRVLDTATDRSKKQEIKLIENEIPKWQVMVDQITGLNSTEFDSKTLAILKGRIVRYLMQSREITLGRSAKEYKVDIDLSLEGPAWKISRRQGIIKMENNGDFYILNEGKRPIYVDGKPVLMGTKYKFANNSIVEIAGLRFLFLMNIDMIAALRAKNASGS